jgi:phage terminase large subunit-like protein
MMTENTIKVIDSAILLKVVYASSGKIIQAEFVNYLYE